MNQFVNNLECETYLWTIWNMKLVLNQFVNQSGMWNLSWINFKTIWNVKLVLNQFVNNLEYKTCPNKVFNFKILIKFCDFCTMLQNVIEFDKQKIDIGTIWKMKFDTNTNTIEKLFVLFYFNYFFRNESMLKIVEYIFQI